MVLTHPFFCPVRCIEGHTFDESVASVLDGRPYALVTSAGWERRGTVAALASACGPAADYIGDINANPTVTQICGSAATVKPGHPIVALGGGSVIDAAKGIAAFNALGRDTTPFMAHLREGKPLPQDLKPAQIIAVPTTSGTGSEVTRWGTIWGDDGIKHSVTDPSLYPSHAVLDPALGVTMPRDLTLATGLDAMSHAMESVWNRRHGEMTDMLSEQAIRLVCQNLPLVLDRPDDTALRQRMQAASIMAGLAMGTTQTALAHSISYPFTSRFGVPHGLACSFTLAEVVRYNVEVAPDRLEPIARAFEVEVAGLGDRVEEFLISLRVGEELERYIDARSVDSFGENLITRARAANNVRDIDGKTAKDLAGRALDRLLSKVTA